ncbi:MAG: Asp-tRNA(Asn)/Glu-tRNA(Gln) amidotransferase subunit GatA [Candidatus Omnitrophica bacterium]|nr:Asp-tRNA(Asn)/Glu-tRNA(Gln) amidotransferase subunit GatA [Candidatus Omnitrophota bacterium]
MTIKKLAELYRNKKISVVESITGFYNRIKEKDGSIHAFLSLNEAEALRQAKSIDRRIAEGEDLSILAGIPLAIKDNICQEGTKTTCASRILESFTSPYDATVITRLREKDAVFLGKTNLDEFAFGSSTENSAFGTTRNPANPDYVPGGSSGGSAAAVAADFACAALGSDTGGSIRQPASFCGVVGLKPTYGRVSRYGLVAFASSLDQIGPFAGTVEDAAIILKEIAGFDPADSTCVEIPVPDYPALLSGPVSGLKVGLPREYFGEGLENDVAGKIDEVIKMAEKLGLKIREISLPHTTYAIAVYYILATAEASANLARFDGVRYGRRKAGARTMRQLYEESRDEGFGRETKRRIILGTFVLSSGYYEAYYRKAQKVRTLVRRDFEAAFKEVDLILTPTSPTPPFKIGEKVIDPLQMYLSDIFTVSANLAGIPGLNLPVGCVRDNLPVGLQILGPAFAEERVLCLAHHLEKELGLS